jgi:hypothetical protein
MKANTSTVASCLSIVPLLVATLSSVCVLAGATNAKLPAEPIYVGENTVPGDGTKGNPFKLFATALGQAVAGDTIVILGAYSQMVPTIINKSHLTIEGLERTVAGVVQPSDVKCNVVQPEAQYCFMINSPWDEPPVLEDVTIRNLSLTGGTRAPIVVGRTVRDITIEHNKLQHKPGQTSTSETGYGLYVLGQRLDKTPTAQTAQRVHILWNELPQTSNTAIFVNNADWLTIAHNTVSGVEAGDGIVANYVYDATIEDNKVSNLKLKVFDTPDHPCDVLKLATGIKVRESNIVTLYKNKVWDSTGAGIMVRVDGSTNVSTDVHVLENTVFHTVNYNNPAVRPVGCPTLSGWPSAMTLSRITGGTVYDNQVYENWGEGVALNTAMSIDAQRNYSHDNFSVNLYLNNASEINVQRNYLWNSSLPAHYRDGKPAKGVSLSNENIASQPPNFIPLRNITIANNMVRGGANAINHFTKQTSSEYHFSGMQNVRIFNNTFYGSYTDAMIAMTEGPQVEGPTSIPHQGNHVNANIFYQWRDAPLRSIPVAVQREVQFISNIWFKTAGKCRPGQCVSAADLPLADPSNDLRVDPAFVGGAGLGAETLKLSPGSHAIDAGAYSILDPEAGPVDFFGTTRPSIRRDVGAHEFVQTDRK